LADINTKNNLWYEFDNFFLWKADRETTRKQVNAVLGFSDPRPLGTLTLDNLNKFLQSKEAEKLVDSINKLISPYLGMFQNFFWYQFRSARNYILVSMGGI